MIYQPPLRRPTRHADAAKAALLRVAGAAVFGAALAIVYVAAMVLA